MSLVIGVDVGGTFTDIFFWDQTTGKAWTAKVPSTPDDQSRGFIAGIESGADFDDIATIVHGTTVGTNALLERKGAKTGLITSDGFRDVLEMRRRDRPNTWGLWGQFTPVISRDLRLEVPERTHADSAIHTAVDEATVRETAQALLDAGAEAACVFFINGYANQHNEAAAAEVVRSVWPNPHVTVATEISAEIREFERASTAALNSYLQPVVSTYLDRLQSAVRARHSAASILIVQSNGGVMSVDTARAMPVRTALSGPAAGVIAARTIAGAAGFPNVITCDMGGTSFDVSLIAGGEVALAAQTAVDFGLVIRSPMIEITTIGAGGGSIASVDQGGLLQIGPESAGSDPGPVCYGLGNNRPTVTDANLVLGRINPDRPIGGKLERLDIDAARAAIAEHVGDPLSLSAEDAAEAILKVANAKMAGAIRLVSIERGHDPAAFAAMPFGGGGALHAGALMRDVGLGAALVPRYPGITSALGCAIADMRQDRVQTVNQLLEEIDIKALNDAIKTTAADLRETLENSGQAFEQVEQSIALDMLYVGQTHTVTVALPEDALNRDLIVEAFEKTYLDVYGRLLDGIPIRVMNTRVTLTGRRAAFDMMAFAPSAGQLGSAQTGTRTVRVDGVDHAAPVYARLNVPQDEPINGPALLEQPDTTIFIDPGLVGVTDRFGNLVVKRAGEE
ncbi:MAG: hydantoinase/oxoprolinase family protein [Pseudomonadota bacterium]